MNFHAIGAIYKFEMARTFRTLLQSVVSPVISTSLYFVVFGAAIGSRITEIDGISYGTFIVPGLIMLSLLTQSIANASFGIYFPKFSGTIYELLSAPVSAFEQKQTLDQALARSAQQATGAPAPPAPPSRHPHQRPARRLQHLDGNGYHHSQSRGRKSPHAPGARRANPLALYKTAHACAHAP